MSKKTKAPAIAYIHVGVDRLTILEMHKAIIAILKSKADQSTICKALDTLTSGCSVNNTNISGCSFEGPP